MSFALDAGASLGIAGESGSGKTTLLHAIAGLLKPAAGGLALSGRPLAAQVGGRSRGELRAIQIVFQNPDSTLNPSHSVLDGTRPAAEALPRPTSSPRGAATPRPRCSSASSSRPAFSTAAPAS